MSVPTMAHLNEKTVRVSGNSSFLDEFENPLLFQVVIKQAARGLPFWEKITITLSTGVSIICIRHTFAVIYTSQDLKQGS